MEPLFAILGLMLSSTLLQFKHMTWEEWSKGKETTTREKFAVFKQKTGVARQICMRFTAFIFLCVIMKFTLGMISFVWLLLPLFDWILIKKNTKSTH